MRTATELVIYGRTWRRPLVAWHLHRVYEYKSSDSEVILGRHTDTDTDTDTDTHTDTGTGTDTDTGTGTGTDTGTDTDTHTDTDTDIWAYSFSNKKAKILKILESMDWIHLALNTD
jgi:hypothetical protein